MPQQIERPDKKSPRKRCCYQNCGDPTEYDWSVNLLMLLLINRPKRSCVVEM